MNKNYAIIGICFLMLLGSYLICYYGSKDSRKKIKAWKDKGLDVSDVLFTDRDNPNIAMTRNSCRVMMTQQELLEQEKEQIRKDNQQIY